VQQEWDRFFDELYLETYVNRLAALEPEAEASAAAELSGCKPGADLLDCPCGHGRHSFPLADAGYRVVGADRSKTALRRAREQGGEREWPRFVEADYRELPFEDASFDAVLNLFSSIGYHGEDADRTTLREFRRVLRPGGALVLEAMHRDRLMSIFRERDWEELPDGGVLFERRSFDPVSGLVETAHSLIRANGEREEFGYRIRAYTATELARMLDDAGFARVEFYGGLLERAPLSAEHRLVAVASA
jgi:ubiquinone/menaquinone biosynthesis C-methylase UbiE